jgi:putative methionine-R-sulfoxide reductase with GAF domain
MAAQRSVQTEMVEGVSAAKNGVARSSSSFSKIVPAVAE